MNFFLAVVGIFLLPLFTWGMNSLLMAMPEQTPLLISAWNISVHFLQLFIQVNVFFLIFNLLPLPNLDGFNLWRHLLGNPEWFFSLFGNPLISLAFLIGVVAGVIPIGLWAYLIVKGLMSAIFGLLPFF
jgi:Zn-dependent protease